MLSMDFIKANRSQVERAIRDKRVAVDLDQLLALEEAVRGAKTQVDELRATRNAISARFKDAAPNEKAALGASARDAGARASAIEADTVEQEVALRAMMLQLPGIPWEGAPVGPDETSNTVIRTEGALPDFGFDPLDHVALIERNDWAELARIVQVSGSRTYCLKGRLALLETMLMGWALQQLSAAGFTPITVPSLAKPSAFVGTGHFPGHEDEAYAVPGDDLYLAGTGEIALTSLHSGEILDSGQLPIRYAGLSPCFRREAGSAGRDVRGLLRVHQTSRSRPMSSARPTKHSPPSGTRGCSPSPRICLPSSKSPTR